MGGFVIMNVHTALNERKYAEITGNDASIEAVAAVTGKRIRVLAFFVSASGEGAVIFESDRKALNGAGLQFAAAGGQGFASTDGLFQTDVGEALNLDNASTLTLGGHITYIEV